MELAFWTLEQVHKHLSKYHSEAISCIKYATHDDELSVGWFVGKFLESRNKCIYCIGLPFKEKSNLVTLDNISIIKTIEEYSNFDIAIIQKDAITKTVINDYSKLYRIQIKRYMGEKPSFDDFILFMKKMLNHYAPDKNLNFVFLIEKGFIIDISKMKEFAAAYKFNFGCLWLAGYYLNQKLDPYLIPIFPKFTGDIWKPKVK